MRVTNWRNECGSGNRQRVSVDVEYEDGSREDYWFELPADIPASRTGSPWLALLLPLAVVSGEDLRVEWPVDPYLFQNAETLIPLWACWFPNFAKPIRIFAEPLPAGVPLPRASASFTAGVDSFFTVLRHPESKFYVNVLGLDMPRWKRDAYERLTSRLERIAQELGARLVRMGTHVRETRWGKIPWGKNRVCRGNHCRTSATGTGVRDGADPCLLPHSGAAPVWIAPFDRADVFHFHNPDPVRRRQPFTPREDRGHRRLPRGPAKPAGVLCRARQARSG